MIARLAAVVLVAAIAALVPALPVAATTSPVTAASLRCEEQRRGGFCEANRPGRYQWRVPAGVHRVTVDLYGAQGGGDLGGGGGIVRAVLRVTPGQILWFTVGGRGCDVDDCPGINAGYNGGGPAGSAYEPGGGGAGGGGASDVRVGTGALADRVLVAGGGGGAGGATGSTRLNLLGFTPFLDLPDATVSAGGRGGGLGGEATTGRPVPIGGPHGTASAGGGSYLAPAAQGPVAPAADPRAGGPGRGGAGDADFFGTTGGGGGGGGWFGGAGGGRPLYLGPSGGGGGGSAYVHPDARALAVPVGDHRGDGRIRFAWRVD
ncbi:MAG: glycine-rich protein [Sporichthyaceae bacterium]